MQPVVQPGTDDQDRVNALVPLLRTVGKGHLVTGAICEAADPLALSALAPRSRRLFLNVLKGRTARDRCICTVPGRYSSAYTWLGPESHRLPRSWPKVIRAAPPVGAPPPASSPPAAVCS